jgi:BolA protein
MSIQETMEHKLTAAFAPLRLEVRDESGQHNVPPGAQSHFKVIMVAEGFAGQRKVQRHRAVYEVLAEELAGPVHALALHLYAPDEWARANETAPESPECRGGSQRES